MPQWRGRSCQHCRNEANEDFPFFTLTLGPAWSKEYEIGEYDFVDLFFVTVAIEPAWDVKHDIGEDDGDEFLFFAFVFDPVWNEERATANCDCAGRLAEGGLPVPVAFRQVTGQPGAIVLKGRIGETFDSEWNEWQQIGEYDCDDFLVFILTLGPVWNMKREIGKYDGSDSLIVTLTIHPAWNGEHVIGEYDCDEFLVIISSLGPAWNKKREFGRAESDDSLIVTSTIRPAWTEKLPVVILGQGCAIHALDWPFSMGVIPGVPQSPVGGEAVGGPAVQQAMPPPAVQQAVQKAVQNAVKYHLWKMQEQLLLVVQVAEMLDYDAAARRVSQERLLIILLALISCPKRQAERRHSRFVVHPVHVTSCPSRPFAARLKNV